jgi:hypothetical protein
MHAEQAKKIRYAFSDSHGLFPHPIQNEFLHYWHLSMDFGMKQYENMAISMDSKGNIPASVHTADQLRN